MITLEQRVPQALALAISIASEAREPTDRDRIRRESLKDIASVAVIAVADHLLDEGWEQLLHAATLDALREERKVEKNLRLARESYEEAMMSRKATDQKKEEVRLLASRALLPREWMIIHRRYWSRQSQESLAQELGLTQPRICVIEQDALVHLRQAFRRLGLTKSTIWQWYYEE